jgi:hypothetical protein
MQEKLLDRFTDFDTETAKHLACSIAIVAAIVGAISMGAGTVVHPRSQKPSLPPLPPFVVEEPQVIRPQPATEWPPLTADEPQDAPERPITMKAAQDAFDVLDEPAPRHRRRYHYRRRG